MFKNLFNKRPIWTMGPQFCFGVLGALMVQFFMPFHANSNIATVNVTALEDSFIQETVHKKMSQGEMKQRANSFASGLAKALSQISNQKNLIIVPSEAVVAGRHLDLTEEVANQIKQGLPQ